MRKFVCIITAVFLLSGLLTGCSITINIGGEQNSLPEPSSTAATSESEPEAEAAAEPEKSEESSEATASEPQPEAETTTQEQAFSKISVKVQAGSLHITAGDAFSFVYADGSNVQYTIEDATLYCDASFTHHDGLLTLPAEVIYDDLSVSVDSGHVYVEGSLQTSQFALDLSGGEVSVLDIQVSDSSQLQVNKGSLYITGNLGGQVAAECTNGNVNLDLNDETTDYDYTISVSMGKINLAGQQYAGQSQKQIDNGAGRTMELTCNKGAMEIGTQ